MTVPSYVPAQYRKDVAAAGRDTGLGAPVVAAQIDEESGFNPGAVSPSDAEGIAQFLPSTYNSVMGGKGSPFNVGDAFDAYTKYMSQLLKEEHGSVQDALAAYNAGPGDIQAGMGYANTILAHAHESSNATAKPTGSTPTQDAQTTGLLSGILNFGGVTGQFLNDPIDGLERMGLVLFGGLLILLGIAMVGFGPATGMLHSANQTRRDVTQLGGIGGSSNGPRKISPEDRQDRQRRLSIAERDVSIGERRATVAEQKELRMSRESKHSGGREPNPEPKHS